MNQKIKYIISQIYENIQIILVYLYAFLSLNTTISGYFGEIPDFLIEYFPYFERIIGYQIRNFQSSDRSIFMYLIIINILTRTTLPLSKMAKFNIILILIFEMVISLIVHILDFIMNRDLNILTEFESTTPFYYYENVFYSGLWVFYFFLYLYCFIYAIQKKYPKFPGSAQKITDSILFLFAKQDRMQKILEMEKNNNKNI